MRLDSLAFRLFLTAACWTLLVLPVAGVMIFYLYKGDIEEGFNERLKTLLTVIQADSIEHAGHEPGAPGDVGEPLFGLIHSGWYWQINPLDPRLGKRLVSVSLATETLPSPQGARAHEAPDGMYWLDTRGPGGQRVRIAEVIYRIGDEANAPRYSFAVAGPLDWLEARLAAFRTRLATALAVAGLLLLGVTWLQVRFGLAPLRNIERGLARIRSGEASELSGKLSAEIEPLQHELNALMRSNQEIIDRARTQVGNLAHALKTPLAVVMNEAREDVSPLARKVAAQAEIMRDQVNLYLDRARMAARAGTIGRVTAVRPVIEPLKRALERIYRDRGIVIEETCAEGAQFAGEKQDLEEMLGNLADNACKWAARVVRIEVVVREPTGRSGQRRLVISIDDDGRGLTGEQRSGLGKRGVRLDETKPGSGLGLSIVADLAHSYRGQLRLEASVHGGLSAILELPAV